MTFLLISFASVLMRFQAMLLLFAVVGTLFQVNLFNGYAIVGSAILSVLLSRLSSKKLKSFVANSFSSVWAVAVLGIFACVVTWVWHSAYIPWRDNDAFQFWMPKAINLIKYGYLPQITYPHVDYTFQPSYPPGFLVLSSALQYFSAEFSWLSHRLALAMVAFCFFILYLKEYVFPIGDFKRAFYSFLPLLLLTVVQMPMWANGYHDVLWALGWGVLWGMFARRASLGELLPLFTVVALAKNESILFSGLLCAYFILKNKNLKLSVLLLVPATWIFIRKFYGWETDLFISFPMHNSLLETIAYMSELSLEIVQFRTSYGFSGVCILLGAYYFIRNRKRVESYFWIIPTSIYAAVFALSALPMSWNVLLSWPRLMVFPMLIPMFVALSAKIDSSYTKNPCGGSSTDTVRS